MKVDEPGPFPSETARKQEKMAFSQLDRLRELNYKSLRLGILSCVSTPDNCSGLHDWIDRKSMHKNVGDITGTSVEGFQDVDCEKSSVNLHGGKVFVGNISYRVRRHRFWGFCEKFGKVISVYLARDDTKKRAHRGYGFVTFEHEEDAKKLLHAPDEDLMLENRQLRVAPVQSKMKPKVSLPMRLVKDSESEDTLPDSTDTDRSGDDLTIVPQQQRSEKSQSEEGGGDMTDVIDMESLDIEESLEADGSNIMILNNHILLHIFSFLTVKERIIIERVCKRWRLVVLKSWQSVVSLSFENTFGGFTHFGGTALTDYILNSILMRGCQELKSLDLSASPHLLTDWSINKIGKRCKNLLQLDLSGVKINNNCLRTLAGHLSKLQSVKLCRCFDVGEKGLWWLYKHCNSLVYVDISENIRITGQCFHILNSNCETVIVRGCTKIGDVGMQRLTEKCQKLTHLDISDCSTITNATLNLITKNCREIKVLLLSGFYKEVDATSLAALSLLHRLEKLQLSHNRTVDDKVLIAVSKGCQQLRYLDIEGCFENVTDVGIKSLAGCPLLQHLNISYLDKISDSSVQRLALEGRLKHLVARACLEITNESMTTLAHLCRNLEHLDVSGCDRVTDDGLSAFLHQCEERTCVLAITAGGTGVTKDSVELFRNTNIGVTLQNMAVSSRYPNYNMMIGMPSWSDEDDEDEDEKETSLVGNHGDTAMWSVDGGLVVWAQDSEDFLEADDPAELDWVS